MFVIAVEKSPPAKHARLDKSPGSPSSSKESSPKGDKGKTPKSKPHGKDRQSKGTERLTRHCIHMKEGQRELLLKKE